MSAYFQKISDSMTDDQVVSLVCKYPEAMNDPDLSSRSRVCAYLHMREQGQDHRFALMCACQQPPGSRTEREFFAGRHTLAQQFAGNERQLEELVQVAQRCGYRPNPNDVYEPGLARFPGDPRGFVPPTGAFSHVRRLCEQEGIGCQGDVSVKRREPDRPIEAGALAPDIVNEIIEQKLEANPDLARVDRRDLAAEVQHQHGYTDAKRAGRLSDQAAAAVLPKSPHRPRKKKRSK